MRPKAAAAFKEPSDALPVGRLPRWLAADAVLRRQEPFMRETVEPTVPTSHRGVPLFDQLGRSDLGSSYQPNGTHQPNVTALRADFTAKRASFAVKSARSAVTLG